jgi:hypothetical protein
MLKIFRRRALSSVVHADRCVSRDLHTDQHVNNDCILNGQIYTWYSLTVTPRVWPVRAETCKCVNCK